MTFSQRGITLGLGCEVTKTLYAFLKGLVKQWVYQKFLDQHHFNLCNNWKLLLPSLLFLNTYSRVYDKVLSSIFPMNGSDNTIAQMAQ